MSALDKIAANQWKIQNHNVDGDYVNILLNDSSFTSNNFDVWAKEVVVKQVVSSKAHNLLKNVSFISNFFY